MLVLTRKVGEQVFLGKTIWIKVVEIRGNKVRLGLEAPEDVAILRHELIDAKPPSEDD